MENTEEIYTDLQEYMMNSWTIPLMKCGANV